MSRDTTLPLGDSNDRKTFKLPADLWGRVFLRLVQPEIRRLFGSLPKSLRVGCRVALHETLAGMRTLLRAKGSSIPMKEVFRLARDGLPEKTRTKLGESEFEQLGWAHIWTDMLKQSLEAPMYAPSPKPKKAGKLYFAHLETPVFNEGFGKRINKFRADLVRVVATEHVVFMLEQDIAKRRARFYKAKRPWLDDVEKRDEIGLLDAVRPRITERLDEIAHRLEAGQVSEKPVSRVIRKPDYIGVNARLRELERWTLGRSLEHAPREKKDEGQPSKDQLLAPDGPTADVAVLATHVARAIDEARHTLVDDPACLAEFWYRLQRTGLGRGKHKGTSRAEFAKAHCVTPSAMRNSWSRACKLLPPVLLEWLP